MTHGIDCVLWDNIGKGWIIECLCGWSGTTAKKMEAAGRELDEHVAESEETHDNARAV